MSLNPESPTNTLWNKPFYPQCFNLLTGIVRCYFKLILPCCHIINAHTFRVSSLNLTLLSFSLYLDYLGCPMAEIYPPNLLMIMHAKVDITLFSSLMAQPVNSLDGCAFIFWIYEIYAKFSFPRHR